MLTDITWPDNHYSPGYVRYINSLQEYMRHCRQVWQKQIRWMYHNSSSNRCFIRFDHVCVHLYAAVYLDTIKAYIALLLIIIVKLFLTLRISIYFLLFSPARADSEPFPSTSLFIHDSASNNIRVICLPVAARCLSCRHLRSDCFANYRIKISPVIGFCYSFINK
jgi:hypothetical protein